MANLQAWQDRKTIIILFHNLQSSLKDFKDYAKDAEKFKNDVMDDPARLAEMKKLIDEDPKWEIQDLIDKYNEYKAIYDYLIGEM